jgi:hypothetical protein
LFRIINQDTSGINRWHNAVKTSLAHREPDEGAGLAELTEIVQGYSIGHFQGVNVLLIRMILTNSPHLPLQPAQREDRGDWQSTICAVHLLELLGDAPADKPLPPMLVTIEMHRNGLAELR